MSRLESDSLFLGLTRQSMIFGVPYQYAAINGLIALLVFIITTKFSSFLLLILLHGIAYLICLEEPRSIELFIAKMSKCNKCQNKSYHKYTNSYDPY